MDQNKEKDDKIEHLSNRVWTVAVRPAWDIEKMEEFARQMIGVATVWLINHDKDIDAETGEVVSVHTHILLQYATPRKLKTVANLLDQPTNQIEKVNNYHTYLRYLTHLNNPEKFQYDAADVITNSKVNYLESIAGKLLTSREIAEYIKNGRMQELFDVVPDHKLRQIQALVNFDNQNQTLTELRELKSDIGAIALTLTNIETMARNFEHNLQLTADELRGGFNVIANAISKAAMTATIKRQNALRRR